MRQFEQVLIHYISLYSLIWDFFDILNSYKYENMHKITHILENVVRCKYFEAGVHIKNPIKELISRLFRSRGVRCTKHARVYVSAHEGY